MKRILLAATILATPAMAQEPQLQPHAPKIDCMALAKFKADNAKAGNSTITVMTPGQFHFLAGAYTILPPMGLPPGDGAIIVSEKDHSWIVWTRGKLACNPTPIDPKFLVLMAKFKVGGDDADTL
jgi:hypothetical protein